LHIGLPDIKDGSRSILQILISNDFIKNKLNGSKELVLPITGHATFSEALLDISNKLSYRSNQPENITLRAYVSITALSQLDYLINQITLGFNIIGSGIREFAGIITAAGVIVGGIIGVVQFLRRRGILGH
jgi:hypothetical protein